MEMWEMIGCRCSSAFIRLKEPAGLPPSHRPSVTAVTLLPSNQTLSASYLFCTRVNHNLHLFYYLVCLLTPCIDVPFLFCIYMWLSKRLNAMLWFLRTFQHLTKSFSFPSIPHMLDMGKQVCAIIWGKNKQKNRGVVIQDVARSLTCYIALVLSSEAGSASSLLLKPSPPRPALRVTRAHHRQARVFLNSLHDTSLCNLQCQSSCTMAIKSWLFCPTVLRDCGGVSVEGFDFLGNKTAKWHECNKSQ